MCWSFPVGNGALFGLLISVLAVEVLADEYHMAIFPPYHASFLEDGTSTYAEINV